MPQTSHTRRARTRRTSSSSGTWISTHDQRAAPADASRRAPWPAPPSAESRRARSPPAASGRVSRSRTMPMIRSSLDQLAAVHHRLRPAGPRSDAARGTASRRMSPVEIFGNPVLAREPLRLRALARPGGPIITRFSATRLAAPSPDPRLLHEPVVVPHDELRLDLAARCPSPRRRRSAATCRRRRTCTLRPWS